MGSYVKTDNDFMADKVGLRAGHLPAKGEIRVLDCFAGTGRVWKAVKRRMPRREIRILGMEKRRLGFNLPGDNLAWLAEMDLSRFNVIDLDSYGIPYDQMKILFDRGFPGVVYVTFIQTGFGQLSYGMLEDIGFSREMIKKTPTIFQGRGWQYLLEWLALRGVRKVFYRHGQSRKGGRSNKYYLAFTM